ncbi:MAG: sugar phosphate isomerase/epimerase [Anaerolineae bacterium]|nr:sugar phosphate isomerase/epimerase [Anaerolineae bacterium]
MRLGVGLHFATDDPEEIARGYVAAGYSAAVCPAVTLGQTERVRAIQAAFARNDVMLAEIGAWNNMLDPDLARRRANIEANIDKLALADEIGVLCCVNIAGSFNVERWDGPHPENLSEEAFELTVQNVRTIVDTVKPRRAKYSLETMPWVIPDSADSYLRLVKAIDRSAFAVHLDPVNIVNSPKRYYHNADLLRECFEKLGPWIISCHAKDIVLRDDLTVHLDEMRPGLGGLDYRVFLRELNRLPGDIPLMLEHLPQEEYPPAREYVLSIADELGIGFHQAKGE